MSRDDEIVEIEGRMEFYFRDLDQNMSFTSEEIQDFRSNWQRLNELDPPPSSNQKSRLIFLVIGVMIVCLLCIIITMKGLKL